MQTPPRNLLHRLSVLLGSPRMLVGCGVLFAFTMFSVTFAIVYGGRQDAIAHSIEWSQNTLLVLQRDIAHDMELSDLALQGVVDDVRRPEVMATPAPLRRAMLFDRSALLPFLGPIWVTDATGRIVIDSRWDVPPAASLANDDFFKVQRDKPAWGLYVSPPHRSQLIDGKWAVFLSRRVTNTDGSFLGVVVGAISVDHFSQLLSGLKLGAHGAAALIHTDGVLVMRAPDYPAVIGLDLRRASPFRKMMESSGGTFADIAAVDGRKRIYTFAHLPGLPLIAHVAPAVTDVYAHWRARTARISAVMALLCSAFIGAAILLSRALGQKDKAESALRTLAQTDSLTGLANRRTLDEMLEREWRLALRKHRPLSILFVDLDHFKAFNDRYGHQAGDDVLIAVGRCLAEHARRPGDVVARYGGEEFVVVLPETESAGALSLAENLRNAIAQLAIEHAGSDQGKVTVSIGVASWQGKVADSVTSVVKAADEALYQAKAIGRNRVFGTILG
ncbi:MAG TPA: sensor domain-containing diguanylate cyclase [Trinickia sp.]|jgi:diguanylate cyclase (GGDEF)-like protein|uniref:sensor domain-containing diguanylate cyclase n=1 Tax=Trinickia sp. TaxID=2571163 RepID=UPI002C595FB8|nr:sensor domain-containing diguanylate cyclase [Trinickia sp.]HTI17696.1 sensor domain-containing diguanylate cyclase [Trinickia sp.]